MNFKIIIAIIGFLVIGSGIFYYQRNISSKNKEKNNTTLEKTTDFEKNDLQSKTQAKILIWLKQEENNEIISYDLKNDEKKLIFTDTDEDFKIQTIGNYAYLSNELIIYSGDTTGQLRIIKLDENNTTTTVADPISRLQNFALSPDGKSILFQASENLYKMASDGSNKRELVKNKTSISTLGWDKNAENIVFTQNQENQKAKITTLNLESLQENEIYNSDNQILNLDWHPDDRLVFSEGSDGKIQSGKVFVLNRDGGEKKLVLTTKKDFPYTANISPDFTDMAFILKTFADKFDENINGQAAYVQIGDDQINKISNGQIILGWML